jgi:hypothetical protein
MKKRTGICLHFRVLLIVALLTACSDANKKQEAAPLSFLMKNPYTSEQINTLLIPGATAANLKVKIDNLGEPFEATIPLGEIFLAPDAVDLSYRKKTSYKIMVSIYADDGALLASAPLSWVYDFVVPPKPIVGFSKVAAFDQNALLLFASNRGPLTRHAWVAGDLGGKFPREGDYFEIPSDGRLPIVLSGGDGNKEITVKYRNAFGLESEGVSVQIYLKTEKPSGCDALVAATLVKTPLIRLKLLGTDPKPLFFGVQGDTAETIVFKKFSFNEVHEVELTPGDGPKKVTVLIRDEAENFCLRKNFVLTVDPSVKESSVQITGNPPFTEAREVELNISANDFPDTPFEMLIAGALEDRQSLWQPFQPKFKATLSAGEGEKVIQVFLRTPGSSQIRYASETSTFYNPFVYLKQGSQGKTLILSDYARIVAIDVTGCAEGGVGLKPVSSMPCTPVGSEVKVTYHFDDGSKLDRVP